MTDAALFGLELQRARERRSLSLDQLAEATKISGSLFAGLERGDLSRWPTGIFRRAFVRCYAQTVGLDAEETVTRFLRLFPDTDAGGVPAPAPAIADPDAADATGPRLVLDDAAAPRSAGAWRAARRIVAPLLDGLLAAVPAAVASAVFGWHWFFPVVAVLVLVGQSVSLALMGLTPGAWLLRPRPAVARRLTDDEGQARRRPEPEPVAATGRRRQPRHASSSSARPVPTARTHRVQH